MSFFRFTSGDCNKICSPLFEPLGHRLQLRSPRPLCPSSITRLTSLEALTRSPRSRSDRVHLHSFAVASLRDSEKLLHRLLRLHLGWALDWLGAGGRGKRLFPVRRSRRTPITRSQSRGRCKNTRHAFVLFSLLPLKGFYVLRMENNKGSKSQLYFWKIGVTSFKAPQVPVALLFTLGHPGEEG